MDTNLAGLLKAQVALAHVNFVIHSQAGVSIQRNRVDTAAPEVLGNPPCGVTYTAEYLPCLVSCLCPPECLLITRFFVEKHFQVFFIAPEVGHLCEQYKTNLISGMSFLDSAYHVGYW